MKVEILDKKDLDRDKVWVFCKGNLFDYLNELKSDFYEYSIQRKIVKNQYLDRLLATIESEEPLTPITLTLKLPKDNIKDKGSEIDLDVSKVEILDGLQRTFRLWSYFQIDNKYDGSQDARLFSRVIKNDQPELFDSGVISLKTIKLLIEENKINKINELFKSYDIYFSVWMNLNDEEIIKKMLILNAGQKSVTKTHQYELLYLHYYDSLDFDRTGVRLIREKDKNASDVKAGRRKDGEFMFTSVITSLVSFAEGNPRRVSLEDLDIVNDNVETPNALYSEIFSLDFLENYLRQLLILDKTIYRGENKDLKRKWFSKDTFINGIYAGLGRYLNIPNLNELELSTKKLKTIFDEGFDELLKYAENDLKFEEFQDEYSRLNSISVNIGSHLRKIIASYIFDLLQHGSSSWKNHFSKFSKN